MKENFGNLKVCRVVVKKVEFRKNLLIDFCPLYKLDLCNKKIIEINQLFLSEILKYFMLIYF